jgi:hypothetical protein
MGLLGAFGWESVGFFAAGQLMRVDTTLCRTAMSTSMMATLRAFDSVFQPSAAAKGKQVQPVHRVRISGDIADCDDRMRGWSQSIRRMGRSSGYR